MILVFVFQGKFVFPLAWILKASINSGNVQPRILAFQCECDIQNVPGVKVSTWDLIPELILSEKRRIHMDPIRNGSRVDF